MAHVELPEEELEPLLESIQEAFKPLQKAMPLIMKIPEEIKRVADNISQDVESGVPEKIADGIEKLTKDEAEDQLRTALSEAANKQLEKQTELLQVLLEKGIPAKIEEGKLVKLTEKEIKETQVKFKEEQKYQEDTSNLLELEKNKETDDLEKQAEIIQKLEQNIEESQKRQQELQQILGDKVPGQTTQSSGGGFQSPGLVDEMKSAGGEVFTAPLMAITELKDSFVNNVGGPIMSLIKQNKEQHEEAMDYAETGEKSDKISILKFLAIAAGIAALVNGFAGFFGFGEETQTKEEAAEEAKQKSLEAGDDEFTAEMRGKQASAKVVREGFFDVPSWFGLRDEATDITTEKGFQNIFQTERFKKSQKSFKDSENFQQLTGGSDFTQREPTTVINNIIQDNKTSNITEGPTIKPGANSNDTTAIVN